MSSPTPPFSEGGGPDEAFNKQEVLVTNNYVLSIIALMLTIALIFLFLFLRKRSKEESQKFAFFDNLESAHFDIPLPPSTDEYYDVKDQVIAKGWVPGQGKPSAEQNVNTPGRELGQALMKRAIANIPLITRVQKEAAGMHRLHSKNMCSETQWLAFQAVEKKFSVEVDEVRAEADEIEAGWGGAIWKQGAQYFQMLQERQGKMQEEQIKQQQAQKVQVERMKQAQVLQQQQQSSPQVQQQQQQQQMPQLQKVNQAKGGSKKELTPDEKEDMRKKIRENLAADALAKSGESNSANNMVGSMPGVKKGFLEKKKKK